MFIRYVVLDFYANRIESSRRRVVKTLSDAMDGDGG